MVESNSNSLFIMPHTGTLETVSIPKWRYQWIEKIHFKILVFSVLLPPSIRGFFTSMAVTSIRLNRGGFSRPTATPAQWHSFISHCPETCPQSSFCTGQSLARVSMWESTELPLRFSSESVTQLCTHSTME